MITIKQKLNLKSLQNIQFFIFFFYVYNFLKYFEKSMWRIIL